MRTIPLRSSFFTLMAATLVALGCGDSGSTGGGPSGGSPPSGGEGPQGGTPTNGGEGPVGGNPTPVISCSDVEGSDSCTNPDPIACECTGCELDVCTDGTDFNDCVCANCAGDSFCANPALTNCMDDGECDPFNEGCLCTDCAEHPSCASGWIEICDNDTDDNGDGNADCTDIQCSLEPACQEVCDNTTDDNGNGDIDCADAQCIEDAGCLTASCAAPVTAVLGANAGTTIGDTLNFSSSCSNASHGDVYTFTPATTGTLTITLASPDADLGFSVRTDCDDTATEAACEDAEVAGTDETGTVAVTAATPITIIVQGFTATEEGPYTLTLALP